MRAAIPLTALNSPSTLIGASAKPIQPVSIPLAKPKIGYPWSIRNVYCPVVLQFSVPATAVPTEWDANVNLYLDGMIVFSQAVNLIVKFMFTFVNDFYQGTGLLGIDLSNNPLQIYNGSNLLADYTMMNLTTNTIISPSLYLNAVPIGNTLSTVAGNGGISYEQDSENGQA